MVFAYTRDNLGTDFTLFLYLAVVCAVVGSLSFIAVCYYLCCFMERLSETEMAEANKRLVGNQIELGARPARNLALGDNHNSYY